MTHQDSIIDSANDIVRSVDHVCDLIVVVPVYRNAKTLCILVDEVHKALDESTPNHRILMVDDASPDNSWHILRGICESDPRVGAIRLSSNSGQQLALVTGLSLCNAPWVAIMDADLQDTPELLPKLLEKARNTDATVFAERHGQYENWSRMFTSKIYKTLLCWITGVPSRCGTFFLTSEKVLKAMLECNTPVAQVVVMAAHASPAINTVPFERKYCPRSESAYNFRSRFKAALQGFKCALYCLMAKTGRGGAQKYPLPFIIERLGWA